MNSSDPTRETGVFATLGAIAVMVALVIVAYFYYLDQRPEPVGSNRDQYRIERAAALRATNQVVLNNFTWVNQDSGVVGLPVERAMDILATEWADPTAGRAKLLGRHEKANVPPPNPYE